MSLIANCVHANPVAPALPALPVAAAAPNLAPAQGDHVFGDVIGTIGTALQLIFGGGANWQQRMSNFNPTLATLYTGLGTVNFGHPAAGAPVVNRNGAPEPDQHAHMFGGLANRLQWTLCEVVCTGFAGGVEVRQIAGGTHAWRNQVLGMLDDLLNNLVDSTALQFYIATPGAIRAANPAAVNHATMSLANASAWVGAHHGPGKAVLNQVLGNYATLRTSVRGLLDRFDGRKTLVPANNTWT